MGTRRCPVLCALIARAREVVVGAWQKNVTS